MAMQPGTQLGPYEVTGTLGAGGMGEVYRARDTRLKRDVALKILPESFATDPERLARFQREAEVLASLNHPHIAGIYGLEEADGTQALVLELVEGETLADRIARGPIPVDEALPLAKQIAEALEAAHEHGVIHRDLKPANIKVTPDGVVKVLDFGLAKLSEPTAADSSPSASMSPTITSPAAMTGIGTLLGTAAYMSPEQAKGKPADKRSDVWAFGAVLYEMLTGQRAFKGEDVSDTTAAVLRLEPDWSALPGLPPVLETVLRRCLQKESKQRLADVQDLRLAMEGAFEVGYGQSGEAAARSQVGTWRRVAMAVLGVVVLGIVGLGVLAFSRGDVVLPQMIQFQVVTAAEAALTFVGNHRDLAVSPDGTNIVYKGTAPDGGRPQLYVRPLGQVGSAPLRGAEGGLGPFFSPDGGWVGFVSFQDNATLQKVSILGGPPVAIAESPAAIFGASWGDEDRIVFGGPAGLFSVAGSGGEPASLTTPEGAGFHAWPSFIPGRGAVVFVIGTQGAGLTTGQLAVLDLETSEIIRLGLEGVSPQYVPTGHLVYAVADGSVRAVAFDADTLEVVGSPVPVMDGVGVKNTGAAAFGVSNDGLLVYAAGEQRQARNSFVWVDRDGAEEPVDVEPRNFSEFALSPDGTRIAVRIFEEASDVWLYDIERGFLSRLTFRDGLDQFPTWTPDGLRVAFSAPLSWVMADGTGQVEILDERLQRYPQAFTPDGSALLFEDRGAGIDLGVLSLVGERESVILLDGEFDERNAALSPDGRWVAYESNESGQSEIYVRPFPNVNAGRWPVSAGVWPIWNPAGPELFFVDDDRLMAQTFDAESASFALGALTELFVIPPSPTGNNRRIAIAPDGQRFLFLTSAETDAALAGATSPRMTVVVNWFEELEQRVPLVQ